MANQALENALGEYEKVEQSYVERLEERGIKFAPRGEGQERVDELRKQLKSRGAEFRNAGASIRYGWLSQACVDCTGSEGSETFATTFKCHRDCFFCFNHNQPDYDTFVADDCPWEQVLADSVRVNHGKISSVGLTGGEPLLDVDESIRFLDRVAEVFPGAHTRMYTTGDQLTPEVAQRLADAGLHEIRFSIKQEDNSGALDRTLQNMRIAKDYIPDVMVEMPVIPGTRDFMERVFGELDSIGISGINLLEFCFPFCNWEEFDKRGFVMKNPPFDIMYDYDYSGGLAVAGSEELCLELMLYGIEQGVSFGMHYCSLDNKHRSQMRQQNEPGAKMNRCFEFDKGDFFLKTAKVFGEDRERAMKVLQRAGCHDFIQNDSEQSVSFNPRYLRKLRSVKADPAMSFNVLEHDAGGRYLREVGMKPLEQAK